MYQHKTEARSHNHFRRRKAEIITYSQCVSVALVIQHAMRMRRVILSSVVRVTVPYLMNGNIFGEKMIKHEMCVLVFSTTLFCKISVSKKNSEISQHRFTYVV
jgi:hypothetical protein